MQDFLTWGAVIGAASSIIALIKFWISMGRYIERTEAAETLSQASITKCELFASQLAEYKLESSREFASFKALSAAENRFADAVNGMRADVNRLTDRLDRFMERHRDDE